MKKMIVLLALIMALAPSAYAQSKKPVTKHQAQAMTQKVSDFDPSIVYTKCDPRIKPDSSHRTWEFPGISPMIPSALLKKAGLSGRNDMDFVRVVLGAAEGEAIPQDQREALQLANDLMHKGFLAANGDDEEAWQEFKQLVAENQYRVTSEGYECGAQVDQMTYGAGNFSIITRNGYRVGFTPAPNVWSVGPVKTKHGWKYENIVWECFNINPRPAPVPVAPAAPVPPTNVVVTRTPPPPSTSVVTIQKLWLDKDGKETKAPKHFNLTFGVTDPSGRVLSTVSMKDTNTATLTLPIGQGTMELREDPNTVPKGWQSRLTHQYFTVSDPDQVVKTENVKSSGKSHKGLWIGLAAGAAAGTLACILTHSHHGDQLVIDKSKVGVPLPPRP